MRHFTSIVGESEEWRPPEAGKIRLGERDDTPEGKGKPSELEYFRFDAETHSTYPRLRELLGAEPKKLTVLLPSDDYDFCWAESYQFYGSGAGIKCEGNGQVASRKLCATCKQMVCQHYDAPRIETEVACNDRCPYRGPRKCEARGTLSVLMPEITMGGLWRMHTKSLHSRGQIRGYLHYLERIIGHLAFIEIDLYRKQIETHHAGGKQIHWVPYVRYVGDRKAVQALREAGSPMRMLGPPPAASDEGEIGEPALDGHDDGEAATPGAAEPESGPTAPLTVGNGAGGSSPPPAPSAPSREETLATLAATITASLDHAQCPKELRRETVKKFLKNTYKVEALSALTDNDVQEFFGQFDADNVDWAAATLKRPF